MTTKTDTTNQETVVKIVLEWYEMLMAGQVGLNRKVTSLKRKDKTMLKKKRSSDDWVGEMEGAMAEMATAKALNLYFDGSVDTFKANDIGGVYQVRWSAKDTNSLIVRNKDADSDIFIFVTGELGEYVIQGWSFGYEVKSKQYLRNPNSWGEAWFMPCKDLKPLHTLPAHR